MISTNAVRKMHEPHPNIEDLIESGKVGLCDFHFQKGRDPHRDSVKIRRKVVERSIPHYGDRYGAGAGGLPESLGEKVDDIEVVDITKI